MAGVVVGALVVATRTVLPSLFSGDPGVRDAATAVLIVVGLIQPLNAAVFVLDGILIGAGDTAYLAVAMLVATAVYLPVAGIVAISHAGLLALWGAMAVWMVARFAGMAWRYSTDGWIVTGAAR
jgi:Na+-driven multidrug efflux pump